MADDVWADMWNSAVCYCSDVSKNRFDVVSKIWQTFGHATWC